MASHSTASAHVSSDAWLARLAILPCSEPHAAASIQLGLCHSCSAYSRDFATAAVLTTGALPQLQAYSRDFAIAVVLMTGALPQLQCLQQGLCHSCSAYNRGFATAAVLLFDRVIQLSSAKQLRMLVTRRQHQCLYRE